MTGHVVIPTPARFRLAARELVPGVYHVAYGEHWVACCQGDITLRPDTALPLAEVADADRCRRTACQTLWRRHPATVTETPHRTAPPAPLAGRYERGQPCGTPGAYARHRARGETPDVACVAAAQAYWRGLRARRGAA